MSTHAKVAKNQKKRQPTGIIPPQARAAFSVLQAIGGGTARDIFEHPSFRAERKNIMSLARHLALLGSNDLIGRRGKRYVVLKDIPTSAANGHITELAPLPVPRKKYERRILATPAVTSTTTIVLTLHAGQSVTINCVQ